VVAPADTVYECGGCGARYLGERRCDECNRWCARVGPGGSCPNCDEPVAVSDIVTAAQLVPAKAKRRRAIGKKVRP
jgi:hypothetical protein